MHVQVHVHGASAWGDQRSTSDVSLNNPLHYFLKQHISVHLVLTDSIRLAGQQVSGLAFHLFFLSTEITGPCCHAWLSHGVRN